MQAIYSDQEDEVWSTVDDWRNFMSIRYPGARVFSEGQEFGFRTCYRSWRFGGLEFAEIHSASRQSHQVPDPDQAAPAAACGISPRYVHMLMRGTGRTFSQYLLERCHGVLQGIEGKRHSITEIAFGWGFNDVSHFSRSFRNRHGMPPREFRRQA